MKERMKEIIAYSDMIGSLVKRDLRGKYKGSLLGFLWTFINPLCQIIVYTVVFSVIVRSSLDKFYVYMIVGMIPWLFFDMSLRQGAGCVRYQGDMIKKIYFPREVLPIACVTSNFVNMLFCFIIVFIVMIFSGVGFSIKALFFLPLVMGIEYMLSLGFALMVSAGTVFFKDLEHIVTVILMAWIYGTPILYDLSIVPPSIKWIFLVNPMTAVIQSYQRILYYKVVPTVHDLVYASVVAIVIVLIGELIFRKLDDNFAEEL